MILVLDKGQIVETGTHRSLLDKDGLYAHLCALQSFLNKPAIHVVKFGLSNLSAQNEDKNSACNCSGS